MLTYGSLFAGIGGFDAGFDMAGMTCRWQVEKEKDAIRVLAHHWPEAVRHDDVRSFPPTRSPLWKVDVICGGFPCQDLSIAGKRAGLDGERSGLFFEMVRIVDRLRPLALVFENVPGLFSSDAGRDFARVLRSLADIGYFGAWRVLDTQFFGCPQRRRRIFGVFARGRAGAGFAAEVLALTESRSWDSKAGGERGTDVAYALAAGAGGGKFGSGRDCQDTFVAGTLQQQAAEGNQLAASTLRSRQHGAGVNPPGRGGEDDQNLVVNALNARNARNDPNGETKGGGGVIVRRLTPL